MRQDHATALQPGRQSKTWSQKNWEDPKSKECHMEQFFLYQDVVFVVFHQSKPSDSSLLRDSKKRLDYDSVELVPLQIEVLCSLVVVCLGNIW